MKYQEFMKNSEQVFLICPAYPVKVLDSWKVIGTKSAQEKLEKKGHGED
jgi:hypothetical protein